jgi:protein arginine kinase
MPAWFDGSGPEGDVVVSTRIRLARNVSGRKFPARASIMEKRDMFQDVARHLSGASRRKRPVLDFEVIDVAKLRKIEQHFLVEERKVSADLLKGEGSRGVACDPKGKLSVMINEEDHLRIQGMDSGFHTFDLWEEMDKLDDDIGAMLRYAYSERLGFLTACPTNSGTGLRVSYLMHLPALVLTKAIEPVLQGASQMGISTRGFFGEHSDVLGNFFQLSNRATLGASEAEFIESASGVVKEIIGHERSARERLMKEAKLEVSDKVGRACGILRSARMLSFGELLNLTSSVRLGIECGLYSGYTTAGINRIVLICMPAHLQVYISNMRDAPDDLEVARADAARTFFAEESVKGRRKKN